jgi:hypothetical protein
MSIFYIQIATLNPVTKIIEIYNREDEKSIEDVNMIQAQTEVILSAPQAISINNQYSLNDIQNFDVYYILTESNTFYLLAVHNQHANVITPQIAFGIIEEMERQNIKLQVETIDNNTTLTKTAQQNLSLLIENYISQGKELKDKQENDVNKAKTSDRVGIDNSVDISLDNPLPSKSTVDEVKEVQIINIVDNTEVIDAKNDPNLERYQQAIKKTKIVRVVNAVIGITTAVWFVYKMWC